MTFVLQPNFTLQQLRTAFVLHCLAASEYCCHMLLLFVICSYSVEVTLLPLAQPQVLV